MNAQAENTLGTVRELNAFVMGGDAGVAGRESKMDGRKKAGKIQAAPPRPSLHDDAPLKKTGTYGRF